MKWRSPAEKDKGDEENIGQLVAAQLGIENISIEIIYEIQIQIQIGQFVPAQLGLEKLKEGKEIKTGEEEKNTENITFPGSRSSPVEMFLFKEPGSHGRPWW